jgi:glycerate 2-kinase
VRVGAALRAKPNALVSVIAIGKAAPAMTEGALARWGDAIHEALVVTTDDTDISPLAGDPRVEILRGSHPIPDRRSRLAAERCLERARACSTRPAGALLLVLVSGGASALVCAPARGVTLREKQSVTRAMLASGASIQEINVVRRHLSRIKGGGLARAASPCPVATLVVSDVIGGVLGDVGSGPSVGDRSTVSDARRLLRAFAPGWAELPLVATGPASNVVVERIVASPEDAARAMAGELRALGLVVRILPPSQASASELAVEYVALAKRLRPGTAVVRAAEPSIVIAKPSGKGGRSTHLAALVGLELAHLPRRVTFLAAATDGVDGASGTGGAAIGSSFESQVGERAIRRALARFDTGPLHRSTGTALPLRPSGNNLADLHVLIAHAP